MVFIWLIILMVFLLVFSVLSVFSVVFSVLLLSVLKFLLRNKELMCVLWLIKFDNVSVSVRLIRKFLLFDNVCVLCMVLVCQVLIIFSFSVLLVLCCNK